MINVGLICNSMNCYIAATEYIALMFSIFFSEQVVRYLCFFTNWCHIWW